LSTLNPKLLAHADIPLWRRRLRESGRRLVVTNGCFDVLHVGHVRYLRQGRALGDALLVLLNGDASVRALKGEGRPINVALDRAEVLAALEAVDAVAIFDTARCDDLLRLIEPDVYAKGGDYTAESLDADERAALDACGAEIRLLPLVPGQSTTATIGRMKGGG
jgi:rfaE bifunctional protein nucleotidyltransferase chain/domain